MTTFTNIHGVEDAIARAVQADTYDRVGDISITGLIRSAQVAYLEHIHRDEIVEDVSERLWSLLGQAIHEILARANLQNVLQEERLTVEIEGWTVAGKPDLWREPSTLKDYKVTSVWSFLLGDKPEWEQQLNFYAVLYRRYNFHVETLTIAAILRDHQKSRIREDGYPLIPFMEARVPCWSPDQAEEALVQRVRIHQKARQGDFGPCTPEERWARPDTWALKKPGAKRALRVFETEAVALNAQGQTPQATEIEYRPGQNPRCETYCAVAQFCDQWKALKGGRP